MSVSVLNNSGFSHESAANETVEWYTPPFIFEALGLTFDLDPCSSGGQDFVPATAHYTESDDGLTQPWHGSVFMNPPYGTNTPRWMKKLSEHGKGIALVFARTDTGWFTEAMKTADTVCFLKSRVRFINGITGKPGGSPGAGSMLIAWGEEESKALVNSDLGVCMEVVK